jgi:hypothetical protein
MGTFVFGKRKIAYLGNIEQNNVKKDIKISGINLIEEGKI